VTAPLAPDPDVKDWTWAIHEPCPACGYDPTKVEHDAVPALTRRYATVVAHSVLADGAAHRPRPTVWSALEYGCHLRDVCTLFDERLHLMLDQDDPQFPNWDQDDGAVEQRYWAQQPATVADAIRAAADRIASSFATVEPEQWTRPGRRSNGSAFTIDTFARYFLHDLAHHAWDVTGKQW
jgi:hypothetical protein